MALTVTPIRRTVSGNRRVVIADIAYDSSYPTGGEALLPSDLGLTAIDFLQATPKSVSAFWHGYDHANAKLVAYQGSAQVAGATDLSAVTVRVHATGN